MPAFFANNRGSVSRVNSNQQGGILPFRILAPELDMLQPAPRTRAIVTQAAVSESGSYQFRKTLSSTIYAYVFGDQIGELQLSGLCFLGLCSGDAGGTTATSGMQQVIDNYKKNRISTAAKAIQVSFGTTNYRGFLVGMHLEINDPEANIGQWMFRFNTFLGE